MSVHERRLAIACRETRQGVIRLINLVEGRTSRGSGRRGGIGDLALLDELNRYLRRTEDLSEAALRAPCLGVVGMAGSGAGELAEDMVQYSAEGAFVVHTAWAAEPLDYVSRLAPPPTPLGRAVTQRFQSRAASNSARMPVALALLKPTDLVMILVRLYASDVARAKDVHLDTDDLRRAVIDLGQYLGLFVIAGMTTADIYAIRDHINALYGTRQLSRALEAAGFWSSSAAMITHLPNSARGRLLSPLWGGLDSLTSIFVDLMDALEALGYADEALAPIETVARVERSSQSLVPRIDSIAIGETARGFTGGDTEPLDVQTRSRQTARITRSALAALALELRWSVKSRPGSLLSQCDILQLPEVPAGTRQPLDVQRSGYGSSELLAAFHRAKVEHAFRRAAMSHELTALSVAVDIDGPPSHRLAPIVAEWVSLSQGADLDQRAQADTCLAVALTNVQTPAMRSATAADWDHRIESALDTVLGVIDPDGAKHWVPGHGFDNVALLRLPGMRLTDRTGRVAAAAQKPSFPTPPTRGALVEPAPRQAGEAVFAEFIASAGVRMHVRNPYAAWADLTSSIGGVGRLAALVEPAADAIVKQRHVAEDLSGTCRELKYIVERHLYRTQSLYGRLNRRHREALIVVTRLRRPDVQGKLGSLLKSLQLTEGELTDALYNFEMRPRVETVADAPHAELTANVARRTIGDGRLPHGLDGRSYAAAAIAQWFTRLRTVARSPEMSQTFGISRNSLLTLAEELIAGASRTSLVDRLSRRLEPLLITSDDPIGRASMVALQAVELIGSFITELDGLGGATARDDHWRQNLPAPSLGLDAERVGPEARARSLDERVCRFHDTWCLAFLELVRRNASEGPAFDPQQDGKEELGDLLKLFSFYAVEWGL